MIIFFIGLVVLVLTQRLVELRIANKNTRKILAGGGREYGAGHYPFIVAIHLLWYIAWIGESLASGLHLNALWPLWLLIFLLTEMLRYWVMKTLGPYWSMRIMVIPGQTWTRRGPYRYCAHPNYLAVTIELFVIPMMFGAWRTASVFTFLYLISLFFFRIPAEEKVGEKSRSGPTTHQWPLVCLKSQSEKR